MRFDDDDDEEGLGPPPDPSIRAWRHPSEIASAEAAAARFARDDERRAAWATLPSLPDGASTRPLAGLVLVTSALALAAVAAGALALTSVGAGLSADAGQVAVGNLGTSEGSLHRFNPDNLSSAIPPLLDASSTTISSGVPLATAASIPLPSSVPTTSPSRSLPNGDVGEDNGDEVEEMVAQTVYVAVDGRRERVGAFTVDGQHAFTPASALAGHTEVLLAYGGLYGPAKVLGIDELTGVAVLNPTDPAAVDLIQRVGQAAPATTAMTGEIMDPAFTATARDDTVIYGTLLTATGCPEGAAGAPLVDSTGKLLGMVIDSTNPLITAVPLTDIRAFVTRIVEPDRATTAWLGVELDQAAKQPPAVTAVTAGSPAAAAGLRVGDVIEAFDGTQVQSAVHVEHLTRHATAGATATVTVLRAGKTVPIKVTIGTTDDRTLGRAV